MSKAHLDEIYRAQAFEPRLLQDWFTATHVPFDVLKGGNSPSNSRRPDVGMMQTAQHGTSDNPAGGRAGVGEGRLKGQAPVRSVAIVIARELAEDCRQVALIEDDHVVEQLRAQCPDKPFGYGVRLR